MTHGSLFSGIGGFDLAAEKMGWENVFHCEINPFGQKVLKYYWPNAISYENIKTTDFSIHRGAIDVLTGGFPCQPYSLAGLRKGKEDERHLWPEMLRAIREIKPRWIVGENVLGLVGWNDGLVFEEVQTDLEGEGYEVQPYVLPAASVNAPHRRDRVWFIGYAKHHGFTTSKIRRDEQKPSITTGKNEIWKFEGTDCIRSSSIANPKSVRGSQRIGTKIKDARRENTEYFTERDEIRDRDTSISRTRYFNNSDDGFGEFPTQSPVCDGDDGLSSRLDAITFFKWRTESIKAGGNAIVHQVVLQIFESIKKYETL